MKIYMLLVCSVLTYPLMVRPMNVAIGSSNSSEAESDHETAASISLMDDDSDLGQLGETVQIKQAAEALAVNKNASRKEATAIGTQLTRKREELLQRKLDWQSRVTLLNSEIDSLRTMYEKYTAVLATTIQNEASYRALYKKLCEERNALKFHHLIDGDQSEDDSSISNNDDDDNKSELSLDDARTRVQKDLGNILDPSNEKIRKLLEGIRESLQSLKELQIKLEDKRKQARSELEKASANHQETLASVYDIEEVTLALKKAHPAAVVDEVVESIEERREEEGKRNPPLQPAVAQDKKGCLLL